ncbi:MAG: hypothetical protein ACYC21_09400 [Eubacteriales bacterium]
MNISFLNDRFTRGFLAGIIATIPSIMVNLAGHYYYHTMLYQDFANILIYGHLTSPLINKVLASFATFLFMGVLGGLFAFLIKWGSSKNIAFKGIIYGAFTWFSIYAIIVLFKVPEFMHIPFKTAFVNFMGGSLWGITLGYVLRWLEVISKVDV